MLRTLAVQLVGDVMLQFGRSMREAGILSEDSDKVSGNNS